MPLSNPDVIADHLAAMAALGRRMPPAWDGARISVPACGPDGVFGRILPGRGLYLDMDRRVLGITRRTIPYVFDRSPVQRLIDVLRDEQGAIASVDDIIAARAAGRGQDIWIRRAAADVGGLGGTDAYYSTFQGSGGAYTPAPGGAAHSRGTPGAWSTGLRNPTPPNKKYLLSLGFSTGEFWHMLLVDLLVAVGNITANSASVQTISSVPLPRYTSGAGVMATFDVTGALGATPATMNVNYTNQSGAIVFGNGVQAMTPSAITSLLQPTGLGPFLKLEKGDYGVRSVQSEALSAAMGAGTMALNLYFPLAFMPYSDVLFHIERDATLLADCLTQLATDAGGVLGCLIAYCFGHAPGAGEIRANLRTVEG